MTRHLALLVALASAGAAVTQLTIREIAIALFMLSVGVVLGAVTLVSHLDVDEQEA